MLRAGVNKELDEVKGGIPDHKLPPNMEEVFWEFRREEARHNIMLKSEEARNCKELLARA